jgi:flagellar hook-associated protein 3 FlgL
MRISTQTFFQRNTTSILERQANTSNLNVHLTEGKRVIHGSDDPVAAAAIQRLKQNIAVNEQYEKNIEVATAANAQEESTLGKMVNILQRVRELMVAAGDGIYNLENLETVAQELEELKEELIGLGNTKDGNSEFIFSGDDVDIKPFQEDEFGVVNFFGNKGVRELQVGSGVDAAINDSGFNLLMNLANGNGSFLSSTSESNTGSALIEEGVIFDTQLANTFQGEEYSVHMSDPGGGAEIEYSVYSIEAATVAGNATVKLASVDLNDSAIANVNPANVYPNALSSINISFLATATPGEFEVQINGQSSLPTIYDANTAGVESISIDGMSLDIEGVPVATDTYQVNKYIEPTQYLQGQSIEVNGIRTHLKGTPFHNDTFTLSPSRNTDVFATIQRSIDSLRIPGNTDDKEAIRLTQLNMAQLELDSALGNIVDTRSRVGARMQTLISQSTISAEFNFVSKSAVSKLEDLDMAQAISELQIEQTALEVAQKTFVQLQRLNLFDLLR